jgi:hypothetical protein
MAGGFPAPVFAAIPADGIIPAAGSLLNSTYDVIPPGLHEGALHSWNVAFQRELPARFTFDVAYVGNRGHDVIATINENAGQVRGADNAGRPLFQQFGRTADVTTWVPVKSAYHSLQTKLDRRFTNGLLITTSYTLGRSWNYSDGDSNGAIVTPADIPRSWGRRDEDRLHTFVTSFVYLLPVGPDRRWLRAGPLSQVLGSWQVSGFFTAQSGLPIDFRAADALLRAPGNRERPNATGTPSVLGGIGPGNRWFDTSVFSAPDVGTWGNVGRNSLLDGPRYVNLDATIAKLLTFPHGVKGEFRVDVFNVTNSPHFDRPNGTLGNANFGQITATLAGSERSMRFGLRLMF